VKVAIGREKVSDRYKALILKSESFQDEKALETLINTMLEMKKLIFKLPSGAAACLQIGEDNFLEDVDNGE